MRICVSNIMLGHWDLSINLLQEHNLIHPDYIPSRTEISVLLGARQTTWKGIRNTDSWDPYPEFLTDFIGYG